MKTQRTKEQLRQAKIMLKKPWNSFEKQSMSDMPYIPTGMTRAYKNNHYIVMVYDDVPTSHGPAIRAMIQRVDDRPVRDWEIFQQIKNEIFGYDVTAIEYYPPEHKVLNEFNIYWLWMFPEGVIPEVSL